MSRATPSQFMMMTHPTRLALVAFATLFILLSGGLALAQDNYLEDRYQVALKERDQGNYDTACPMLKRIVDVRTTATFDPGKGLGARVELARCYEAQGKLASAVEQYNLVRTFADAADQKERVQKAQDRLAALVPKVSLLTIIMPASAVQLPGISVLLDDVPIDAKSWGAPLPVDRGTHLISVKAPDRESLLLTAEVPENGLRVSVEVKLPDAPPAKVQPVPPVKPAFLPAPSPAQSKRSQVSSSWQHSLAIVSLGLSAGGIGVGIGLGLDAQGKLFESGKHCSARAPGTPDICAQAGLDLRRSGRISADVATGTFVAGGLLVAGGLVLWLTAPSRSAPKASSSFQISPTTGGLMATVRGEW